jgi:predicted secreted protein
MKTKTSAILIGLVTIATVIAGTVIGVSLTAEQPMNTQTPSTHYLTVDDNNSIVSVKKGDFLNITLQDYGDGGYSWVITHVDSTLLQQLNYFRWGSSGMLGDFGKDTWVFTTLHTGSNTLNLECVRSFGGYEVCQQFVIQLNIV